jgi:CRISPR-associated protein (TIGR02710 family)
MIGSMADDGAILVCTVGGSLPPILKALGEGRWRRVVFVCTRDAEGVVGSAEMVERAADGGPPIPERAGIGADCWEIVEVPPDDPDAAFAILEGTLRALQRRQPQVPIVADFTGGTKSMSAALTLAALGCNVPLQLVTGRRADLVKVLDRSERAVAVHTGRIAAAREFERLAAGWGRFAYQEAADGFDALRQDLKAAGLPRDELGRFNRAQELSAAFAAWDCFDHKKAAGCLNKKLYQDLEIGGRTDWPELASTLARGQNEPWGALHLRDIWHNAERCAARGRYDDAVARLYRLWEAVAQWLLRRDCGIDTAVIKTGLRLSWDLYLHLRPQGAAGDFWRRTGGDGRSELDRLDRDRLSVRNKSILAHGWDPVSAAGWARLSAWTETGLFDVVADEAERLGEAHELPQLPTALPAL